MAVASSVEAKAGDKLVRVGFSNSYRGTTDDAAILRVTGENGAAFFKQSFELKIKGDLIPEVAAEEIIGELQALFARHNAGAALSAKAVFKPTKEFHTARHTLYSAEENMEIDKVVPVEPYAEDLSFHHTQTGFLRIFPRFVPTFAFAFGEPVIFCGIRHMIRRPPFFGLSSVILPPITRARCCRRCKALAKWCVGSSIPIPSSMIAKMCPSSAARDSMMMRRALLCLMAFSIPSCTIR
jgi:hypothetical protein